MNLPKLDDRLQMAADLYPDCEMGADIGSDHGRLPLHLIAMGRCKKMIVSDISAPSLQKAKTLFALHGCSDQAIFRQASGLFALKETVQAVSIMGMGGDTLCGILSEAPQRLSGAALILSPHTDLDKVRGCLPPLGYRITAEKLARAGGRYYVVLKALPGDILYTEKELLLGPCLIREHPTGFDDYLHWRSRVTLTALNAMEKAGDNPSRTDPLRRMLQYIKEELP